MGISFRNTDKWWITIGKYEKLTPEVIQNAINRIETLDRIQIEGDEIRNISKKNWETLKNQIFSLKPNLKLRIYGSIDFDFSTISKLTFIENISISVSSNIKNISQISNFKNLKSLSIVTDSIENIEFLNNMVQLTEFSFAQNIKRSKNVDLTPISRLTKLKLLSISGYDKNIHQIFENLIELETIHFRSISSVKSIDFITHIQSLKKVIIQLGGIYLLSELEKLNNVQYLQLWRINKLEDISFISNMTNLQFINLETLNKIEKFPSIENLSKLKRLLLSSCKNMVNFESLKNTTSLTDFIYQNAKNQQPNDFLPVISNKKVTNIGIGFPRVSEQKVIEKLFTEYGKTGMTYQYPSFKKEFIYDE